jgi:hypothetical protein
MVKATPRPFYPRDWRGTHCIEGCVDSGTGLYSKENFTLTGIRSSAIVQPVGSRYTDYAILVLPCRLYTWKINAYFDT